jgi:hypothetical protein
MSQPGIHWRRLAKRYNIPTYEPVSIGFISEDPSNLVESTIFNGPISIEWNGQTLKGVEKVSLELDGTISFDCVEHVELEDDGFGWRFE